MKVSFILLLLSTIGGIIALGYEPFGRYMNWPVGKLFQKDTFKALGGLSLVCAIIFSVPNLAISWIAITLILGCIVSFLFSLLLKSFVQFLAVMALFVPWLLRLFWLF